jgi:uncharacterized cupredoxin-like copper-binding protein
VYLFQNGKALMKHVLFACLFALAVTGHAQGQAPDWTRAKRIDAQLTNFRFTPDHIILTHGQPYVLHIVNASSGGHDFNAKAFFKAAAVAPEDAARANHGEVELHGGDAADIRLIAPAAGSYELHCGHFMHQSFGMKGVIEVQ